MYFLCVEKKVTPTHRPMITNTFHLPDIRHQIPNVSFVSIKWEELASDCKFPKKLQLTNQKAKRKNTLHFAQFLPAPIFFLGLKHTK